MTQERPTTAGERAAARQKRLGTLSTNGQRRETFRHFDDLWADILEWTACGARRSIQVLDDSGEWVTVHVMEMSEEIAEREDDFARRIQDTERREALRKVVAAFGFSLDDLGLDASGARRE